MMGCRNTGLVPHAQERHQVRIKEETKFTRVADQII